MSVKQVLSVGLVSVMAACASEGDEELVEAGGAEERSGCLFIQQPTADDSASLIGGTDLVHSEGISDGGCDLHAFNVTAAPTSGDRIRLVQFEAFVWDPPAQEDMDAVVWRTSCTEPPCRAPSATHVPLAVYGDGEHCTTGVCGPEPYRVYGEYPMSATNEVHNLRAGMRALDGDGDPLWVNIYVSE